MTIFIQICFVSLLFSAYAPFNVVGQEFGAQVRECRIDRNENLNKCLHDVLANLHTYMKNGVPSLNVDSLDPIKLDVVRYKVAEQQILVDAVFHQAEIQGMSTYTATDIRISPETAEIIFDLTIPVMKINGIYKLDGTIFDLPLTGSGNFQANIIGISANGVGKLSVVGRGDAARLRVSNYQIDFTTSKVDVKLDNLQAEDPIIARTVDHFVKSNGREVISEGRREMINRLKMSLEKIITDALSELPLTAFRG